MPPLPPLPISTRNLPANSVLFLGVDPQNPGDAGQAAAAIAGYTAQTGRAPGIVSYYMSWSDAPNFDSALADVVYASGATPFVTWSSHDWSQGIDQPAWSDQQVADGAYDAYIARWGREMASYGKDLYLRLDHEMNGDWYSWSPGVNGNTAASFVAMWRHVVTLVRQQGATNVRWVWCPNIGGQDFRPMYPGDRYVDWVGLDGYNYGAANGSPWKSFTQIFRADYEVLHRFAPTKPIVVAEVGSVEAGGIKAEWLASAFLTEIPAFFPEIRGVIYFDEDKTTTEGVNWLLTTSPTSLSAWQRIAGDNQWRGRLPLGDADPLTSLALVPSVDAVAGFA